MGLLEDAANPYLTMVETASGGVSTPGSGEGKLILDTDGLLKLKDDAGVVRYIGDLARIAYQDLIVGSAPSNPSSGFLRLYGKTGNLLAVRTSAGSESVFSPLPAAQTANADTSGATLGQLETEVNELKAALRAWNIIAT